MIAVIIRRTRTGCWTASRTDEALPVRQRRHESIPIEPVALRAAMTGAERIEVVAEGRETHHWLLTWSTDPIDRDRTAIELDQLPQVISTVIEIVGRPNGDFQPLMHRDAADPANSWEYLAGWPKETA